MTPSPRGSAGVAALILATALLILGAWLVFGTRDPAVEQSLEALERTGRAGSKGPVADVLADEADALSKRYEERNDTRGIPTGARLVGRARAPVPPTGDPPGVEGLAGRLADGAIELSWRPSGGTAAAGYVVERLDEAGNATSREEVPASARRWRDDPVAALSGTRRYRVQALGGDRAVAGGMQKTVSFRVTDFEVKFLGAGPDGQGRFRVEWDRADTPVSAEFVADPGGEIGGEVAPGKDRPALDLRTGWRFLGIAGKRVTRPREVQVPRFSPNGLLEREPDSGKVVFEVREAPVPGVRIGAKVDPPGGGTEGTSWLQKAKD